MCLAAALLMTACGAAPAAASAQSPVPEAGEALATSRGEGEEMLAEAVYRGSITAAEDGRLEVGQVWGHNYGQSSIVFHIGEDTEILPQGVALAAGGYVEVKYNGILTRSLPPQASALSVRLLSPHTEGIVVNGIARSAEETEDGWRIVLEPFANQAAADAHQAAAPEEASAAPGRESDTGSGFFGEANLVILVVPSNALEGLEKDDLTPGVWLSAVTKGIAALSMPPQMPVLALLPYTV